MMTNGTPAPGPEPTLAPIVKKLQSKIESDHELMKLFEKAFQEIPEIFQHAPDGFGFPRIRDYRGLVRAIDQGLASVPSWTSMSRSDCVLGCPINEALIWFMNTRTGSEILARKDINTILDQALKQWATFLSSSESVLTITEDKGGWLSVEAKGELLQAVNTAHNAPFVVQSFEQAFICDPSRPAYGFPSWDAFFTRTFVPGVRPISDPNNHSVIVNPCEAIPFALATDIATEQEFRLKGTTYSVPAMLDNDPLAGRFTRGTVLQGWLSPFNYHRWHAPVAGTVVRVRHIAGTYFVADPANGFERVDAAGHPNPDRQAPDASQKLVSAIATRQVVVIEADDARLGCVGFVAIGMADVSGCVASVRQGDYVSKGQEMGSFHYGGSSFCLLFEEEAPIRFSPVVHAALQGHAEITEKCIAVKSEIARVVQPFASPLRVN